MTEQIQDQISAFADDELSVDECEFLVRRLERDPEVRRKVLSYALIGASVRGEVLDPDPDLLRRRIQAGLGGELSPRREVPAARKAEARFLRPVLGAGIAATVAVAALVSLNTFTRVGSEDPAALMASDARPTDADVSYVVPQETATNPVPGNQPLAAPIRLTTYLMTHGEYASGLGRTSIHTNVVGNQGNWVVVPQPPENVVTPQSPEQD